MTLEDMYTSLSIANSYMVVATRLENGKLYHDLLTNNFPKDEMIKSLAEGEKLVIEELKKPGFTIEPKTKGDLQ